jgi:3-hydroxyacyl-[acyl-carrier-protein] dehydratase
MLLIDQIVEKSANSIKCAKTFRDDEYFTQGHFPDFPIVPGVILCECALQAGAILLANRLEGSGNYVPIATRLDNVKFKQMVRPGDSIEINVTLNETISNAFFMTGKITVAGKIAARLDFACSIAEKPSATGA